MKKSPTTELSLYSVLITIGTEKYLAVGNSILEALSKIKPKDFGKGLAVLEVEHGDRKVRLPLKIVPTKLKRVFELDWEMQLFAKRIATLI